MCNNVSLLGQDVKNKKNVGVYFGFKKGVPPPPKKEKIPIIACKTDFI